MPAFASAAGFGSVGTSGGQFLELPESAHAAGMADADVALARGAEGLEFNPARLATLSDWDLLADQVSYLAGINLEQAAAAWGRPGMGVGMNVVDLSSPQVPETDASGNQIGTFGEQDLAVALGGAMSWGSLSAGVTARWVKMTLAGYGAGGAEGDVGLAWQPLPSWHLGLAAQHLGSYSAYSSVADPAPMLVRGGVGWEEAFDNGLSLSLEADAVDPRDGSLQFRGGGELGWSVLFIRVGGLWSQDYDSQQTSTLGAGVKLGDVTLDYAFGDFTGLGATQRFGLSWRPGAALAPRPRGIPGSLRALREGGDLLLSWTPVAGSQGYWVYLRRAHGADPQRLGKQPIQGSSVRLHKAAALGDLGLAVSSLAEDGSEGPRSDELRVESGQGSAETLGAPQAAQLSRRGDKRVLSWVAGEGGDGQLYQVMASRRSGSGYGPLGPPQKGTSFELDPSHAWREARFVVVRALRQPAGGTLQESPFSKEVVVAPR
ncbi:MAG TPA: PorV/PorQ family protein [bacterium]|nr:PorV/PorQ family protein [bacterium]